MWEIFATVFGAANPERVKAAALLHVCQRISGIEQRQNRLAFGIRLHVDARECEAKFVLNIVTDFLPAYAMWRGSTCTAGAMLAARAIEMTKGVATALTKAEQRILLMLRSS
jgi:hypothetical protein